jgi:hypothetical protein
MGAWQPQQTTTRPRAGDLPVEVEIDHRPTQRRWTVALRALLVIPHSIVLYFVGIAAFVVLVIGWFAALVLQRLPNWAAEFLTGYLRWNFRLQTYMYLLVDTYPPFSLSADPEYPARLLTPPAVAPANRASAFFGILFRGLLAIPAMVVGVVLTYGWGVCAFVIWLIVLISGGTPRPVFDATAAMIRFAVRLQCYVMLITPTYPKRVFGEANDLGLTEDAIEQQPPSTRPLLLSKGGRILLIAFIVIGALVAVGVGYQNANTAQQQSTVQYR